jgi:hypothetical protein
MRVLRLARLPHWVVEAAGQAAATRRQARREGLLDLPEQPDAGKVVSEVAPASPLVSASSSLMWRGGSTT